MGVAGFTLIEVLVAVTILASGLVMIVEALGRTEQALRRAENLVTASLIADNQMNVTSAELYQYHLLRSGNSKGEEKFPGRVYTWIREIRPFVSDVLEDNTKLSQVRIAVQWVRAGQTDQITLGTVYLNREKKL